MQVDLQLLENKLVPVYTADKGEKVVYGTELHMALGVKTKYTDWAVRRFSECDAVENKDFQTCFSNLGSENHGGQNKKEHIIKLDTAKEMAMLERNEIGKRVRKYFIEVEKKYKSSIIDRTQLSPQMQMFYALADNQAEIELEQKRLSEQQKKLEEKVEKQTEAIQTVKETFVKGNTEEDSIQWVKRCINKIAESPNFTYAFGNRYAAAKNDSYQRLISKTGCRLDQKLRNAITRASEKGFTQAQLNSINKLTVIMADKKLKEIYIGVVKEMMIAYCVEI